jgi:CHAT domain-containing protein
VEDDSTVEFMEQFYARLGEGAAPSVALQATQAAFARHARYSHPRHWAAFTLTGR